ncbi:BON domain-containing protein [Roseiconus nitratireducens]|uniref:BON domain-containing protein n=1 Tax=Roseiconus nitratireducens TaxID=2605748 RepID=A0A5M6DCZ5_9BACT|nr:BON domain-containing protein [Roseiconus nitratireducens]KAA5543045.1 BON domain-containing protein [Roseiconus nitratireducens]
MKSLLCTITLVVASLIGPTAFADTDLPSRRPDLLVENDLRNVLRRNVDLDDEAVDYRIVAGTVVLRGSVDNYRQRYRIGKDVKAIEGVDRVDNRLKIRPAGQAIETRVASSFTGASGRHHNESVRQASWVRGRILLLHNDHLILDRNGRERVEVVLDKDVDVRVAGDRVTTAALHRGMPVIVALEHSGSTPVAESVRLVMGR